MTPNTNPYIADHTPRALITGIDAIPPDFHDVLTHEWNVAECASIATDTERLSAMFAGGGVSVTTVIEFTFSVLDDARTFHAWVADYQPGAGLVDVMFDPGVEHGWTRAAVTCEFVGGGVRAAGGPRPGHEVCDAFVHFAQALVGDRLPSGDTNQYRITADDIEHSGTYALNADKLPGTTNPHANGDGYHATGFVDPADDPETIAGAIRTTGDELDAAREAIIENIELVLDAAGIDESEIREELDGDDAAATDEQESAQEPDHSCPDCASTNTVGFDTGDYVCRSCNHNWVPGEDTGEEE